MSLIIPCPFCGTEHSDEWESLGEGRPEFLRCENPACFMSFAFAIRECPSCAGESVFTWKVMPEPELLEHLVCHDCGEPLRESTQQTQKADPPERI